MKQRHLSGLIKKYYAPFLILFFISLNAHSMTNQQLVGFCQQASAVLDKKNIPPKSAKAYGQCYSFIDGFVAGFITAPAILVSVNKIAEKDWPVCLPNDFNSDTLATDLLRYVRDGGDYKGVQGANTLLSKIIFDLYRCK